MHFQLRVLGRRYLAEPVAPLTRMLAEAQDPDTQLAVTEELGVLLAGRRSEPEDWTVSDAMRHPVQTDARDARVRIAVEAGVVPPLVRLLYAADATLTSCFISTSRASDFESYTCVKRRGRDDNHRKR